VDVTQLSAPRLSIAIMSHPKRARQARDLARRLNGARIVTDPAPTAQQSPLRTAIRSWRAVAPGATHHLVVQDDVELSEEVLRRVEAAIRLFPDAALALYSNWSARNAAAIRLAGAAGATWVHGLGGEYFPTLAVVLPAHRIEDYLEFATAHNVWWQDDDEVMRDFLDSRGIDAYISVPSLVEHRGLESVAGNVSHGERRAVWFTAKPTYPDSYEALAEAIDFCPWMNRGRALALVGVSHRGRREWIQRPWTDMVEPYGIDAAELRGAFDRLTMRSPRLQKAAGDLGDLFVSSLWVTAFLMGTVVRAGTISVRVLTGSGLLPADEPPIARAALHTLAIGASSWLPLPESLLATYSAETTDLVETGFAAGLSGATP
jgi:hypothetical protein